MGHDLVATVKIRERACRYFENLSLTAHFRSLSACILVPEKEKEEVSLCFRGYFLLHAWTPRATES